MNHNTSLTNLTGWLTHSLFGNMHVKVCGVRREEDALLAAELGANAIGLLVDQRHRSPDFISAKLAGRIARVLSGKVTPVLVTHVPEVDKIERLLRETEIAAVQLHSEILPDRIRELKRRLPNLTVFKIGACPFRREYRISHAIPGPG